MENLTESQVVDALIEELNETALELRMPKSLNELKKAYYSLCSDSIPVRLYSKNGSYYEEQSIFRVRNSWVLILTCYPAQNSRVIYFPSDGFLEKIRGDEAVTSLDKKWSVE